jgi:hypothetical protein
MKQTGVKLEHALILSDGKPGHFNQSIALCRHLGISFDIQEVEIKSDPHRVLTHLLDLFGIYSTIPFKLNEPLSTFDIVVSTGSRTYYANKVIARKAGAKSVAILAPRGYRWNFDCLLVPEYDSPHACPNVISVPVNLTYWDVTVVKQQINEFKKRHTMSNKPAWGIIVGGDSKAGRMDPIQFARQINTILELDHQGEIWVTTSRRTPTNVESDLRHLDLDYLHLYSEDHYNPIPAFIHLCEKIFVTGDSTSMLSECVTGGGAKVSVIENTCGKKHKSLISMLKNKNILNNAAKIDIADHINHVISILSR